MEQRENGTVRLALGTREAAAAIGVSPRTLHSLKQAGEIRHFRVGDRVLYRVADLQRWVDEQVEKSA